MRDSINKLNFVHFTASGELHTLGGLDEAVLRETCGAAGGSGEFYTPRAAVRLMVAATDPGLGETVHDPTWGTDSFLVEAFDQLSEQGKTVAGRRVLQEKSLFGCEPKTLPYLLCPMNLLRRGLVFRQSERGSATWASHSTRPLQHKNSVTPGIVKPALSHCRQVEPDEFVGRDGLGFVAGRF